uniref:Uncharacterized protein n=1 Tax=Strix occidentalis caurina TaxID=311401 RepID=A0A8D0KSK6_STROC
FETPALALKTRGSWEMHSVLQVGSLHLQAGASLAEKLDRQHMALGVQMCIQVCTCIWWPLTGRALWGAVRCGHGAWKDFNCPSLAARQGTHTALSASKLAG